MQQMDAKIFCTINKHYVNSSYAYFTIYSLADALV